MGTAEAEAQATDAAVTREPRTPSALRKMTLKAAIDEWATTTKAIEGLRMIQADAAKVLLENADRTGRRTFGDRIAVVRTGGSLVLDQAAVKEELGGRLEQFMKKTKLGWSLKLLK